ncbi:hypothetical protein J5226_11595 [Lysobacter sp. K5869]|uniref:hypothetical protein n=1 Tax=Lysobacter sp. K5869 TaxID=2820808 RepID=UPI001C05FFD2|nr:hypothetical protein [Lysobacter sp. K5869]QWP78987.1 hypothetical protein J5226_11595 [Lysobacter sp. K5869]
MSRAPAPAAAPLTLSIERLRLDGPALTPLQTRQLQRSLAAELTRLHRLEPLAPRGGTLEWLRAPELGASATADPVRLGIELARGLHRALARGA